MTIDADVFHFINQSLSNPAFDAFFPWYTNFQRTREFQFFILPVLLSALFYFFRFRGVAALAIGSLLTWLNDLFISAIIKPLFLRPRPYETLNDVILRTSKPASSSFPSGHAADSFFLASFLTVLYPRLWPVYYLLAFLIAVSRVYLGVHYPGDVTAGALIGSLLGLLAGNGVKRLSRRMELK
jgi:undecaprenyl-diphosphatase